MMNNELLSKLGKALNETRSGVLEYYEPLHADYDQLLGYEREEMNARAQKVIEALASYYQMDVIQMLAILERNRHDSNE